jgi:hypothetical protein
MFGRNIDMPWSQASYWLLLSVQNDAALQCCNGVMVTPVRVWVATVRVMVIPVGVVRLLDADRREKSTVPPQHAVSNGRGCAVARHS